jgi:hypothetical protein
MAYLERNSGQVPAKSYGNRIDEQKRWIGLVQEASKTTMDTVVLRWTEMPSAIFTMIPYGPLVAKTWIGGARSPLLVAIRETAILFYYIKTGQRTLVTIANVFTCCLFLLSIFAETLREHEFTLHVLFPPPIMKKATGDQVTSIQQWQKACRDRGRVLFEDETEGICISIKSHKWVALGLQQSNRRGIFEQWLINMMDWLQRKADDGTATGSRIDGKIAVAFSNWLVPMDTDVERLPCVPLRSPKLVCVTISRMAKILSHIPLYTAV